MPRIIVQQNDYAAKVINSVSFNCYKTSQSLILLKVPLNPNQPNNCNNVIVWHLYNSPENSFWSAQWLSMLKKWRLIWSVVSINVYCPFRQRWYHFRDSVRLSRVILRKINSKGNYTALYNSINQTTKYIKCKKSYLGFISSYTFGQKIRWVYSKSSNPDGAVSINELRNNYHWT